VESNEVAIATTGVDETTTPTPTYNVWCNGIGVIHVEWDTQNQVPQSIVLTDVIGRTISTTFTQEEGQARINVEQITGAVFVTIENAGVQRTYGVLCMP